MASARLGCIVSRLLLELSAAALTSRHMPKDMPKALCSETSMRYSVPELGMAGIAAGTLISY